MTARLTDEDIGDQLWLNSGNGTLVELLAELQARRAADLSADETDSIIRLRNELRIAERRSPDVMYYPAHHIEAREALDNVQRVAFEIDMKEMTNLRTQIGRRRCRPARRFCQQSVRDPGESRHAEKPDRREKYLGKEKIKGVQPGNDQQSIRNDERLPSGAVHRSLFSTHSLP